MIGLKRFIRPGIAISVGAHVGAFALGLLSFAGSSPQTGPPDAMEVELVTPTEAPRLQGTPSEERTSGSEMPFKANNGNAAVAKNATASEPAAGCRPGKSEARKGAAEIGACRQRAARY